MELKDYSLKGTHLLTWLKKETIEAIEQAAFLNWQKASLIFRFLKVSADDVTIGITQANKPDDQYLTQKELIKEVHETFDRFFKGKRVLVHASAYQESPALKVNPAWIKKKMEEYGVKLKNIAEETGMNYSHLSGMIGGTKPLSDATKAMFYFYFKDKENNKS